MIQQQFQQEFTINCRNAQPKHENMADWRRWNNMSGIQQRKLNIKALSLATRRCRIAVVVILVLTQLFRQCERISYKTKTLHQVWTQFLRSRVNKIRILYLCLLRLGRWKPTKPPPENTRRAGKFCGESSGRLQFLFKVCNPSSRNEMSRRN